MQLCFLGGFERRQHTTTFIHTYRSFTGKQAPASLTRITLVCFGIPGFVHGRCEEGDPHRVHAFTRYESCGMYQQFTARVTEAKGLFEIEID